jgi:hypothetical protein
MPNIEYDHLVEMTGLPRDFIKDSVSLEALKNMSWQPVQLDRDQLVLNTIKEIEKPLPTPGPAEIAKWERGWAEVAARIADHGVSEHTLKPQYYHSEYMRLFGNYVIGMSEYELHKIISELIFKYYFSNLDSVVEFACGTGINLLRIGKIYPNYKLIGSDWATPTISILNAIAEQQKIDVSGKLINLWTGAGANSAELVNGRTGVLTVHGLEQVGSEWKPFLKIVDEMRPSIIVHIEPIAELYDENNLLDFLALRYHKKRKYLSGYLTEILNRKERSEIEVIAKKRLRFGSKFHEAYSLLVWKHIK